MHVKRSSHSLRESNLSTRFAVHVSNLRDSLLLFLNILGNILFIFLIAHLFKILPLQIIYIYIFNNKKLKLKYDISNSSLYLVLEILLNELWKETLINITGKTLIILNNISKSIIYFFPQAKRNPIMNNMLRHFYILLELR